MVMVFADAPTVDRSSTVNDAGTNTTDHVITSRIRLSRAPIGRLAMSRDLLYVTKTGALLAVYKLYISFP